MYYVNLKQQKILDNINKFGCMTYEQIKELSNLKDLDKELKILVNQRRVRVLEGNIYVSIGRREVNNKVLKALEICTYLNSINRQVSIQWCNVEDFPFTLVFFRNGKIFDAVVINEGEEVIYSAAVNRTAAERIIVILESASQIEKIKINKQAKYCTVENGGVIFLEWGDD
ncbi:MULTISPECIES: DUF5697 family protein [Clostridium]|uniref:DUF5697 family protein n=1 Tax=Clostridium TaxID=1485 RepID=UPI00069CD1F8|nr:MULTISPECIES: DUF5697 family protein [Clostridium]KOF56720.1 hypothetical protein AGR56_08450 [Clostridium sp. DMHC 10]MCD2347562.1 DUF5697 family protein [Clostridium guangxiense]